MSDVLSLADSRDMDATAAIERRLDEIGGGAQIGPVVT